MNNDTGRGYAPLTFEEAVKLLRRCHASADNARYDEYGESHDAWYHREGPITATGYFSPFESRVDILGAFDVLGTRKYDYTTFEGDEALALVEEDRKHRKR